MLRLRSAFLTLVAAFVFAALAPPCSAEAATVERLAEGVYAFVGDKGATNSAFVVSAEGVVVIDTQGPKGLALSLKEKIKEITDKPVIYVINTHYHGDHTFGNQYFTEAKAIIAHDNTLKALVENDASHRERFKKFFGAESLKEFVLTPPTLTFTDRMTLRAGDKTIELVYVGGPAHTQGDIYVCLQDEKVVIAGDLLYNGRLPLLNDGDSSGALKALDGLLNTGATIFLPGHGPVADKKGVTEYRNYLADLINEVKRLKGEGRTIQEVKAGIALPKYKDWVNYKEWLPMNAEKVYIDLSK